MKMKRNMIVNKKNVMMVVVVMMVKMIVMKDMVIVEKIMMKEKEMNKIMVMSTKRRKGGRNGQAKFYFKGMPLWRE